MNLIYIYSHYKLLIYTSIDTPCSDGRVTVLIYAGIYNFTIIHVAPIYSFLKVLTNKEMI